MLPCNSEPYMHSAHQYVLAFLLNVSLFVEMKQT